MRKLLIAGNWKMNGSKAQTTELLGQLVHNLQDVGNQIECVVCPPYPYLDTAHEIIKSSNKDGWIQLGAQNITSQVIPAFTGEISPAMLREFGCNYAIIGHSERRHLLHESNQLVALKVDVALENGLHPIICVGESKEEQAAGQSRAVVAQQLRMVLDAICVTELHNAVIAYEPVWAIGSGQSATPKQAQEMHAYIRSLIAEYDANIAAEIRIIYGGSVNAANVAQLLHEADIDGSLVGGASLKAQEFSDICHTAMGITK